MFGTGEDPHWETWAKRDPYYAVLSAEEFRRGSIDADARNKFFDSGERHVQQVLERIAARGWQAGRTAALDYGCGVGRLVMPFARHFERVVGVDVSSSMLAEARRNCEQGGVPNVQLIPVSQFNSELGQFDLVHSCLVLQHIPVPAGLEIISRLASLLKVGGVGALQFPLDCRGDLLRRATFAIRARIRPAHALLNWMRGRPAADPPMLMNSYPLNRVYHLLHEAGVREITAHLTKERGYLQAFLFFERRT